MESDIWLVLRWWEVLFFVGAAAYPLTRTLFRTRGERREKGEESGWWDGGYLFSKAVGMAVVGWLVYALGTLKILPFTVSTVVFALIFLFVFGVIVQVTGDKRQVTGKTKSKNVSRVTCRVSHLFLEELFFLMALLFWSWIKAHEPSIRGLEKFMDYGFMQSILNSRFFPPGDMWYPPGSINYYYFGHLVTAVLTKLSGLDLTYTFNLMLATLFALTLTMSFSIGCQLSAVSCQLLKAKSWKLRALLGGALTAFLVTLAGNMQTIYAFTRGYTGDNVRPFWELFWPIGGRGLIGAIREGLNTYWYANATRFIPFSIHEFPSYSFVVSDVHGHVLSIPFVLLAIGLLIQLSAISHQPSAKLKAGSWKLMTIFYGFLVGVLLMTNALDGPIYFILALFVLVIIQLSNAKTIGIWSAVIAGSAILTSLPFLSHFRSFVSGIAVNCPPEFLANTKIGPLLFEGVEKCQRSPLWMLWILWGFFLYCGVFLIRWRRRERGKRRGTIKDLLLIFFLFSIGLIIFPEFFYFKDIYPAHFRSNTMFKLGYQAFILFSIVAGYTIVDFLVTRDMKHVTSKNVSRITYHVSRGVFLIFLLPQFFLVSIYPIFSVRSYFNGLKNYEGLYGLTWMQREYPDDWLGIEWLRKVTRDTKDVTRNNQAFNLSPVTYHISPFVLVEADGDSYTDYGRFSAFTGIPTIIGWGVHEWLWRGSYDVVAPRREKVREIYESEDLEETRDILTRFGVCYVVVGTLERQKYPVLQEWKFAQLGRVAFQSGQTTIYRRE